MTIGAKDNFSKNLMYIIIVLFSVSLAFTHGAGNRNLLLIGFMFVTPFLLFIYILKNKKIFILDIILILYILATLIIPPLFNPDSLRWSTVFYSYMFIVTFMLYEQLLYKKSLTKEEFLKIIKILIFAYSIVLIIQQICVLIGLPIFNVSNYEPNNPWKLNSLAPEPSQFARIISLLFYIYIRMKEIIVGRDYNLNKDFKDDIWIWLAFIWSILTMRSGTAFLFFGLIMLKFFKLKNIFIILFIIIIAFFLIQQMHITAIDRTLSFLEAVFTFNPQNIMHADHSASLRIVPMIVLFNKLEILSISGLFGNGIDYVSHFLYKVIPGIPEGYSAGGMFVIWIEYGFIIFLLFTIFSFLAVFDKNAPFFSILFWFLLVFMYGINNQIVWLNIMLFYAVKFYSKKDKG